jgi:hypothetical protein
MERAGLAGTTTHVVSRAYSGRKRPPIPEQAGFAGHSFPGFAVGLQDVVSKHD